MSQLHSRRQEDRTGQEEGLTPEAKAAIREFLVGSEDV